jgi:hypothetical protein
MKIGDKPISEMTKEEMIEAIEALQNSREALRAEAMKRVAEGKPAKEPKAKKAPKSDPEAEALLKILQGGAP